MTWASHIEGFRYGSVRDEADFTEGHFAPGMGDWSVVFLVGSISCEDEEKATAAHASYLKEAQREWLTLVFDR